MTPNAKSFFAKTKAYVIGLPDVVAALYILDYFIRIGFAATKGNSASFT